MLRTHDNRFLSRMFCRGIWGFFLHVITPKTMKLKQVRHKFSIYRHMNRNNVKKK